MPDEENRLESERTQGREAVEELEAEAHAESERAIRHLQTPDGVVEFGELAPRTRDEELVAGAAVGRLRRGNAERELWERLGTFERELIARGFVAGARAQAQRLEAAIGTASTTVDAPALRRILARPPTLTTGDRLSVAQTARRFAEADHEPPAALRLVAVRRALDALDERLRRYHVAEDDGPHDPPEGAQEARAYDLGGLLEVLADVEALLVGLGDALEAEELEP